MNRRIIGALAAVLLATVGTFVLVLYVRGAEKRALAGEQLVEVLVVQEAVAKNTRAEALGTMTRRERVPVKVKAEGAVADLSEISGLVAAVDLHPGEQVIADRFSDPNALAAQGEVPVPDGFQQVTIALEPQRAVGGVIRSGDTVGFFASFEDQQTHLILHKVLVTNVQGGQASGQQGGGQASQTPGGSLLVTLAVDAGSAERIVFVAEHGTIWLSGEPQEASESGTRVQTRETIYQ